MTAFFRFPHTPHLAWLSPDSPREDKVFSAAEAAAFLRTEVVLEEKVDGANVGISVDAAGGVQVQNRGQYLSRPFTGQFARLNPWLVQREEAIFDALGEHLMLFGEWTAAVHSLDYPNLPDYFLLFDVYDRQAEQFWSTSRRNILATQLDLQVIHRLDCGHFGLEELKKRVQTAPSAYRDGTCEGIYLRQESNDWLLQRAKLVHPDFVQNMGEHWRRRILTLNHITSPKTGDVAC
jgi:ATP-dependent RNA circularization protein (DNA/RNA ligase family)